MFEIRSPFRAAIVLAACSLSLGGCIARTAVDMVTAPVRAGAQMADWATTSQDESDRARGRAMREREEELGRLERRHSRAARECADGERDACGEADALSQRINAVMDRPYGN